MPNYNLHRSFLCKPGTWLITSLLVGMNVSSPSVAQLIPDDTLGNQSSIVRTSGSTNLIEGGIRGGRNLFHSFREFNIGSGQSLYFSDPGVTNILTRVTGTNPSRINGRLGVNGNANLFLLNPNGILFGPDASLDIRGSLLASTASAFKFADGSEFSATNPQTPDLLTIDVTPGLQYGASSPGATITNRGKLIVGQNLTLVADRLDLQGQLQAGQDLTLQAQDTLQIRDSATEAFRAIAGSKLIMQGNAGIDILALNHPQTQIQAGSNLTLISDGTISGDAHFTSGGNLAFLTTTETPGIVVSKFDPIIRANGNVTFGNYTGAALKIETTGSIQGGNIRITSPDTAIPTTDPDFTVLTTTPAVILRSGLSTIAGTNTPQTIGGTTFTSTAAQAGNITIGTINTSSTTGSGGPIILEARNGNIRTANLSSNATVTTATPGAKNGGDITLAVINGNITITAATTIAVNASAVAIGTQIAAGAGGSVKMTAMGGSIQVTGTITTASTASSPNFPGPAGNGGAVSLSATEEVQVSSISTLSNTSFNFSGNGGEVAISSTSGNIRTGTIESFTRGSSSYGVRIPGTPFATTVVIGTNGASGGNVSLTAPHGRIETAAIDARALGTGGKGGDLSLSAAGNIRTDELRAALYSPSGSTGTAGRVVLTSSGGSLQTGFIDATAVADRVHPYNGQLIGPGIPSEPFTALTGQGGMVSLSAPGAISVRRAILTSAGAGAGDITINSQTGFVGDRLIISSDTFGSGLGGNILITAPSITLDNGSQITTSTHVSGQGGTITLRAPEFVSIQGNSLQAPTPITLAPPGGIAGFAPNSNPDSFASIGSSSGVVFTPLLRSSSTVLYTSLPAGTIYPSGIFTQTSSESTGNAGSVSIQTGQLTLQDRGTIATTTFGQGNAGRLSLQADTISLRNGNIFAGVAEGASGTGGEINVQARSLTLTDQAQMRASTFGTGRAGDIQVQANDVTVAGALSGIISGSGTPNQVGRIGGDGGNVRLTTDTLRIINDGIISTATFTTGQGGNININAREISLENAGRLSATTQNQGDAGNIAVVADRVTILGARSGLFANTTAQSSGNGGSILLTSGSLDLQKQGQITVDSKGRGRGGDIQLITKQLNLSDRAAIFAETASSDGGNITLNVQDLLFLRHNSLISASAGTAQAGGNGGNITINAGFIISVLAENNDITANAFIGNGGRINITTQGIFGLRFQSHLTAFSDITASSQFGVSGTVTINTLNTDPNRGLTKLTATLSDSSNQIAQTCSAQHQRNSFVVTGRGGLSPDPTEALNGTVVWIEGNTPTQNQLPVPHTPLPTSASIVEITSWSRNEDGSISLIADEETIPAAIVTQDCQTSTVGRQSAATLMGGVLTVPSY